MTTHAANGVSKASGRPSLPYQTINPHLALLDHSKLPAVKFQVITRDGQEIIVGRIKIQTPGGHAFILRRYDTEAISQTTMFRAAFPSASEDLERSESNWVKQNFDSAGANGGSGGKSDALRLAGVWIRPEVAKTIAPDYSLELIIEPLLNARPDPGQAYRRSTKPAHSPNGGAASSSPVKPPGFPSSPPGSPRPKRRKPTSSSGLAALPRRSERMTSPEYSPAPVPTAPPVTPATRSMRTHTSKTATTATKVSVKPGLATPEEEEYAGEAPEEEVADVPGPSMQDDVAEQKELIAKLKAERAEKERENVPAGPSSVPLEQSDSQSSSKRARENEEKQPLKFQFREPGAEGSEEKRKIRSNRRISLVGDLEPQQKSAAWGALWFAAGLAAAATIPTFFM